PLDRAWFQHLLADRADAGTFGDDGFESIRLPGGLKHQLAAEREAEAADPSGVDVGAAAEIVECRLDVSLAAPAVGITLAFAGPARGEDQGPVAMAHEHARVLLRAAAARGWKHDHGGSVSRGHVPAGELQPVVRREGHILVTHSELSLWLEGAAEVRVAIGDEDREDDLEADNCGHKANERTADVST